MAFRDMKIHDQAFLVLGCLGLLLQGVGTALLSVARGEDAEVIGVLVLLLGSLCVGVGGSFHAVGKGRSWRFGLLGIFTPIGLLFLCVLSDRTPAENDASEEQRD